MSDRVEREASDAAIEAGCRGLINAETNGLCGESWPGPCDMCDCGLQGVTVAVASADEGARRDRQRVAEVLRRAEPFLVAAAVDRALTEVEARIGCRLPLQRGYIAGIFAAYRREQAGT